MKLMSIHTDGGRLNARPVARGEAVEVRTAAVVARTVDVIIAAWNRSGTIERAILSALAEPEVRHVIVVDDGSSDDTAARAGQCGASAGRRSAQTKCAKESGHYLVLTVVARQAHRSPPTANLAAHSA